MLGAFPDLKNLNLSATATRCYDKNRQRVDTPTAAMLGLYVAGALTLLLALIVGYSRHWQWIRRSVVELTSRRPQDEHTLVTESFADEEAAIPSNASTCTWLLSLFHPIWNIRHLWSMQPTGEIRSFDGLTAISICWVILGYVYYNAQAVECEFGEETMFTER